MTVTETVREDQTIELARTLAETLEPGSFIALEGGLGVGKTAFAKGLAAGLGITETVVSPTFTLLRVYDSGRMPLYHYDVYRIGGTDELHDIGFYEYSQGDGVCVCEWAELIADELPENYLRVGIEYVDENTRKIEMEQIGQ